MKTLFNVEIVLPHGGVNSSGWGTLKEAKARLASQLSYLQTDGGYEADALDYELSELCGVCYGDGKVTKQYKRESDRLAHRYNPVYLTCPECKGRDSRRVIIPLNAKE